MITIIDAIIAINPTAEVSIINNDVDQITWQNGTSVISNEQILTKQSELQTVYDAEQWKRNRQEEYPDAIECVHALLDGGDTLTDLQTKRTTIKEKYPKE